VSIPELEKQIDALQAALVFWTKVVGYGLVIEYLFPILESLRSWFKWKYPRRLVPVVKKVKAAFAIVGGILITVGVLQEGRTESLQSSAETSLREANAARIAKLGTNSDEALRNAEFASEKAAGADRVANDAVGKVKGLDTKLFSVESRTSNLSTKLTEASRQVEEANSKADRELKARLKLEAELINVECPAERQRIPGGPYPRRLLNRKGLLPVYLSLSE
jgi:hypothetical protein